MTRHKNLRVCILCLLSELASFDNKRLYVHEVLLLPKMDAGDKKKAQEIGSRRMVCRVHRIERAAWKHMLGSSPGTHALGVLIDRYKRLCSVPSRASHFASLF